MHSRVSDVSSSHANLLEQKEVITQENMTAVSLTILNINMAAMRMRFI